MFKKNRIYLIIIISGLSVLCLKAKTGTPDFLLEELTYIDSLGAEISQWFNKPESTFESVFNQLERCKVHIEKKHGNQSLAYAYILHKQGVANINLTNKTVNDVQNAIRYYQQALKIRQNNLSKSDSLISPLLILGYSNIANCYLRLQNPHESLYYTIKGLNILENYTYNEKIINTRMKLNVLAARTYYKIGDYDNAIKYYSAVIFYNLASTDEYLSEILDKWKARALIELGGLQAWPLFSTDEAIRNLLKGIEYLSRNNSDINNTYLAEAYLQLGSAYHSTGDYNQSKNYYYKSIKICEEYDLSDYVFINYINLSVLFIDEYNYDSAYHFLSNSKSLLEKNKSKDLEDWLLVYDNLAEISYEKKNYLKSLEYDNKAIQCMFPGFNPKSVYENPDLTNLAIADKPWLLSSLASKAQTFLNLYFSNQEEEYLEYAYNTYLLTDYLLDNIRSSFVADASKMNLVKQAKPVYEQAIETCWLLYKNFQCDSCLEQAFHYSEKSRSIILLDAVRKTAARTKLPSHLFEEEKELNLKVNYYEKQVALQSQDESDFGSMNYYDSLLAYRRKHNAIITTIKEQYPGYHNAIFGQQTTSPTQVMEFIQPDQSFIEYFVGDSSIYAFVVSKEKTGFVKLGNTDSLDIWLNMFNEMILTKDQQFILPGYKLYNYLIASIEKVTPLNHKLVIVPDNILSTISFDALITKLPESNRVYLPTFKDFLLYSYQISHVFSASAVFEAYIKPKKNLKKYLGIAPLFEKGISVDDSYFDQLEENTNEIKLARKLFNSGHLLINNVERDKLVDEVGKYAIVHFATHAQANIENGDLSYILFGTQEDKRLYAKDLYALDLNSELVVLSACQTGKGSLEQGEGTISLARGFIYAGSSSVLTSLWNVREKSNSDIVINFYRELKTGKSKDAALRDAKISYLASITRDNQEQAHPFYWSPLIAVGDMSSIHFKNNKLKITIFGLVFLVFSAFFIYSRRMDKST
jgi:CHAT domain-containing protein